MKLLTVALIACTIFSSSASSDASVYLLEADTPHDHSIASISSKGAELWLAHRLGFSSQYDMEDAETATISLLNKLGNAEQSALFTHPNPVAKKLVILEGVDRPEEFLKAESILPSFRISDPSTSFFRPELANDLLRRDASRRGVKTQHRDCLDAPPLQSTTGGFSVNDPVGVCNLPSNGAVLDMKQSSSLKGLSSVRGGASALAGAFRRPAFPPSVTTDYTGIFWVPTLNDIAQKSGSDSADYRAALEEIRKVSVAKEPGQQVTVVCLPPRKKVGKRNLDASEGFRNAPGMNLRKEQPLSEPASPAASQPAKLAKSTNSTIPKTTIPSCYISKDVCLTSTANCAGHGDCKRKYGEKASDDEDGAECWACQCEPTRINSGQLVKTIYWGGPACQKKDISVPFFLFAGFTVAAVTAIACAIGLLYSVGEEDLPSVLGAGVAPTTRK